MGNIRKQTADIGQAIQESVDELKRAHESQWNLPLMAFGAGMLRTRPGIASNFLNEVGSGLDSTIPVIQQQRMKDQDFWKQIADLQQAKGQTAIAPEKMEAEYQGKLSLEAQKLISALNVAGMRSDKPQPVPGTGEVIFPNAFGPGRHGVKLPGTPDVVPVKMNPNGTTTTTAAPETRNYTNTPSPEVTTALQKINPEINPDKTVMPLNWDKLAELAKTNPDEANKVYKSLMYESDPLQFLTKRQGMGQMTFEKAQEEMRKYDPNWSYSDLQAAIKNRNAPDWNTKTNIPPQQLSTGIQHMAELMDVYEKMGNDKNQLTNWIKNKYLQLGGDPRITNQAVVSKFVGDEMAKYLAGGQGSALQDREELGKLLSGNLSPKQAEESIKYMLHLANDKAKSFASQKTEMLKNRRKFEADDLLYPDAKVAREKIEKSVVVPIQGKDTLLVPGVTKIQGMTYTGANPANPKSPENWQ